MEQITLNKIFKVGKTLTYDFAVTEGLSAFFSGKRFLIEYPVEIGAVPDGVAAVPFICNVLPIVWLTNSRLVVKELDQAFYACILNVKKGYETMFPESNFAGEICVRRIVACDIPAQGKSAVFFSGGLDAVQTLVSHLEEKPALISIWGSDIRFDNEDGWRIVHRSIEEYADKYALPDVVIRSSFRDFDCEGELTSKFGQQLKDGWWHGVKHGIGLLGHAAPYVYLNGISTVYIASSNCPLDGHVRCASNPLTDNQVRFADTRVIHDGFEFSRQDKIRNVVDYVKRTGDQVSLHVCWESQSGNNCCHCEKCYRTMAGLIAEGADPIKYGFDHAKKTISLMRHYFAVCGGLPASIAKNHWTHIQKVMWENHAQVRKLPYWKEVQWIIKADFLHVEKLTMPLSYRIRERLAQLKIYQLAHRIKVKLHG